MAIMRIVFKLPLLSATVGGSLLTSTGAPVSAVTRSGDLHMITE
jgi:hypothetical protein